MKRFLLSSFFISLVWADGGMFPPWDYEIYSADQVAIIKILPDTEELSILVKAYWFDDYYGFAWIVPLPSLPEVNEVNVELFTELSDLASPYRYTGGCYGSYSSGYGDRYYGEDYYHVIEYDTIGFLYTVLIHTDLPDSLTSWLMNNGYTVPQGATAIFQDYINRNWNYFFAARADTVNPKYGYENVGIGFRFAADTIFYPMKISSISAYSYTSLYLYVIGENKMFFDGAELEYANKISKKELEAISKDLPELHKYIQEGSYITKLNRIYEHPGQITSDIFIYQSPDDTEYRNVEEDSYWYYGLANSMLLPLLIYVIYIGVVRLKKKLNHKIM